MRFLTRYWLDGLATIGAVAVWIWFAQGHTREAILVPLYIGWPVATVPWLMFRMSGPVRRLTEVGWREQIALSRMDISTYLWRSLRAPFFAALVPTLTLWAAMAWVFAYEILRTPLGDDGWGWTVAMNLLNLAAHLAALVSLARLPERICRMSVGGGGLMLWRVTTCALALGLTQGVFALIFFAARGLNVDMDEAAVIGGLIIWSLVVAITCLPLIVAKWRSSVRAYTRFEDPVEEAL